MPSVPWVMRVTPSVPNSSCSSASLPALLLAKTIFMAVQCGLGSGQGLLLHVLELGNALLG